MEEANVKKNVAVAWRDAFKLTEDSTLLGVTMRLFVAMLFPLGTTPADSQSEGKRARIKVEFKPLGNCRFTLVEGEKRGDTEENSPEAPSSGLHRTAKR